MESPEAVVAAVLQWSKAVIEQPHRRFGNLPICPFAKAARLKNAIRFEVLPFDLDDPLESSGEIMVLMGEFLSDPIHETLFVIHPEQTALGARDLVSFVARLNARLATDEITSCLQVFEAHPRSDFRVGNVYTRRSPFPSFQALRRALLKSASDSLLGSHYYDQFTPQMLEMVGMPRDDERVECLEKR